MDMCFDIIYIINGHEYKNIWEADSLEDAILDAKYHIEDCGHPQGKVLVDKTIAFNKK